jgi:hypothetical protein
MVPDKGKRRLGALTSENGEKRGREKEDKGISIFGVGLDLW